MGPIFHIDDAFGEVLDDRLTGIGEIRQVRQIRNVLRIGTNLFIKGKEVVAGGTCHFDVIAILTWTHFTVDRAARHKLTIFVSNGARTNGAAPSVQVLLDGIIRSSRRAIVPFEVLADVRGVDVGLVLDLRIRIGIDGILCFFNGVKNAITGDEVRIARFDLTIVLRGDGVRNGRTVRRFFHLNFYAVAGFYCDGPYSSFLDDRLPVSCNIG